MLREVSKMSDDRLIRRTAKRIIHKYVDLPDDIESQVVDFVERTWYEFHGHRNHAVLVINGEPGTGKTRLLQVLQMLCRPATRLVDHAISCDPVVLQGPDLGWLHAALVDYDADDVDPSIDVIEIVLEPREIRADIPLIFPEKPFTECRLHFSDHVHSVTVRLYCACGDALHTTSDWIGVLYKIDEFWTQHQGDGHGPTTPRKARYARKRRSERA